MNLRDFEICSCTIGTSFVIFFGTIFQNLENVLPLENFLKPLAQIFRVIIKDNFLDVIDMRFCSLDLVFQRVLQH